jgi:capsular polysaccharide transport system permease protein
MDDTRHTSAAPAEGRSVIRELRRERRQGKAAERAERRLTALRAVPHDARDDVREGDRSGSRPEAQAEAPERPRAAPPADPAPEEARGRAEPEAPDPGPKARERLIAPPVSPARRRGRHWLLAASFLLLVVAPAVLAIGYLYTRAVDQYASTTGFAVRTESVDSAFDMLGGLTQLGRSSSTDTDILSEFIQGQQIVAEIDEALDLRAMYSRPWETDPVFALRPDASIEELVDHWRRNVRMSYDAGTGLIEIRVLAFSPVEAKAIADAIFRRSAEMINDLSAIAREDATRYAREELEQAVERLKAAREAVSEFRSRTQIVDPTADLQGQMGLLNTLQGQLAEALIELDLLSETAQPGDPRIAQVERRIAVIERRIEEERGKFTIGGAGAAREDYVVVLSEFDRLDVDLQFAREAYTAALSAYDTAQAEAQRKSRYLAAYVAPTLPQSSEHPRRAVLSGLALLFLLLGWSILALIYYSIRDRR